MKTELKNLLYKGEEHIINVSEAEFSFKPSENKWSKKEVLGHLIDSAINNLQRFTEIQFENKPYTIRKYNQNELVKVNNYRSANTKHLLSFWLSINHRILNIIDVQTENTLSYEIKLDEKTTSDLRFLINDYVNHLEHHLNQIIE